MACRLGREAATSAATTPTPEAELVRYGLLTDGGVHADLVEALAGFTEPVVRVDLDVALRRPDGPARLHGWHRRHDAGVTAVTVAGDSVELAWWPAAHWPDELARTVTPPPRPAHSRVGPPAAYLRMPYELLLASGPAVREGRTGVLSELLDRHRGRVLGPGGTALAPASATEQVVRLHTGERGRLQVRVTGEPAHGRRLGLVTWVLFADGWRELAAVPSSDDPHVVLRAVEPAHLGGTVARLALAVAA